MEARPYWNGTNKQPASNASFTAGDAAIGKGYYNTTEIAKTISINRNYYCASDTKDYRGGNFSDWFMPSTDEAWQIYTSKASNGWSGGVFSTSTQKGGTISKVDYSNGVVANTNYNDTSLECVMVRAFGN
jgi:hypothetical protein